MVGMMVTMVMMMIWLMERQGGVRRRPRRVGVVCGWAGVGR